MIAPTVGELLRSRRTGDIYKVTMTGDERVTLQSLDGSRRVLTERGALNLFYEALSQPAILCAQKAGR